MKHNENHLEIAGFQELYYQVWQPEKDIQCVILLIHGLGEHGGRYGTHFADFYTSSGFALVVPDLPGHGKTLGPRGHISDNALFLDYIDHFLQKSKELFPGKPIFIYGHSMGGLLVLWYDLARNPQVNGLIVTSPGIHTKDPIAPAKRTLAIVLNAILPSFTMKNGLDANLLSHDPEIVSAYRTDPLVHDKTSARLGMLFINRVIGYWNMHRKIRPTSC
jgi:alpha-beta hydrolase superfamily lysophospholipase